MEYVHDSRRTFFFFFFLSEYEVFRRLNITNENRLDIILYLVDIIGLYLQRGKEADLDIVKSRINILRGVIEGRVEFESKRK